jgi:hypothetical protein
MPNSTNLFAEVPQHLPQELLTTLVEAPNVCIERIVSLGHASPEGFCTTRLSTSGWWC